MRNDHYPKGTVKALIRTDLVTPNTRLVLQNRLEKSQVTEPLFLDTHVFLTLQAVCMRLIPQPEPERMVDLAGGLDRMLAEGNGNGWRYDTMPADRSAFTTGLNGINETSFLLFGKAFPVLSPDKQDEVLASIQSGEATGISWKELPAKLFFEELLAALVELYYSHPFAKEEIGEVAMADAKGWQRIGLNEREAHEPLPLNEEVYASS